ncbi:DNA-binding IclR family transcriptional regulator [Nocardioides daedukensis]|uniref:DNA-binding IclR family transcriptional regulator n=1 Tax=Nocardioides daedukensis TaxID=634462 RepID=A0A7Y9S082_9ACTN|nr:IclR family transcriptional regulator [Nocardioides daedukensis]NYG59887.1 DNA-binding IclR family transcriptional regulator [Nocardioides daedukensis]
MTALAAEPATTQLAPPAPRPGVIERLTDILDVFTHGPDHLFLEEVSGLTGLPRSTTFRLLRQLVEMQWIDHDERGYRLGPRMHAVGRRVFDHAHLRAAAANVLNELHLATSAVVHLVVLDGNAVVYLDKVGGPAGASIPSRVGIQIRAHRTISGLAILGCMHPEEVDRLYDEPGSISPRARARLHRRLGPIRRRHGLALTPADMRTDMRAVAAPVTGPHGPLGAISVALRGPDAPVEKFAPMVRRAALETTALLTH